MTFRSHAVLKGGNIVLGGIVFQLGGRSFIFYITPSAHARWIVSLICYTALAAEYLWRYVVDAPLHHDNTHEARMRTTPRMRALLSGMGAMTVFLFIRYAFRGYFGLVHI
jgi:hypothetical protein